MQHAAFVQTTQTHVRQAKITGADKIHRCQMANHRELYWGPVILQNNRVLTETCADTSETHNYRDLPPALWPGTSRKSLSCDLIASNKNGVLIEEM